MVLLLISVLIIAVVGVALQRTDWNRSRLYRTIAAMLLARADARDEVSDEVPIHGEPDDPEPGQILG